MTQEDLIHVTKMIGRVYKVQRVMAALLKLKQIWHDGTFHVSLS